MPRAKRRQVLPTEEWTQLRLFVRSPEQELYEAVRPIALFGRSVAQRARETGIPERTLRRKVGAFDRSGGSRPGRWRSRELAPFTGGERTATGWPLESQEPAWTGGKGATGYAEVGRGESASRGS